MSLPLPPASNLHSILLVTQSRSLGTRLVFHYPPLSPSAAALAATTAPAWFGNQTSTGSLDDSHSSSSDWDSSTENEGGEDDLEVNSRTSGGRGSGRTSASHRDREKYRPGAGAWGRQDNIDEDDADNANGTGRETNGEGKEKGGDLDWDTVLGFKVDALGRMLCPGKPFNKRRFELGVESLVFVGAPMFVRDDGLWKKARRRKDRPVSDGTQQTKDALAKLQLQQDADADEEDPSRSGSTSTEPFRYPEGFEPGYGHGMISGAPSGAVSEAASDTRSNSTTANGPDMTMFNVVFVLNPPALEYQMRVKDMYDNVTRKYAKALKYEQARFQYVWKESKKIINIKQRAKENGDSLTMAWREIINSSPLAKSIAIMFDAISNDKIAHVHFDATFNTSFQIPQPDSTPYLPNALEPQMPGLWLTTSNVVIEEDSATAPMTQHSALLLLEDAETLVKELETDAVSKGNATALAFYIRNIVPTKSLQKISIKHNILAQDMEYIASHLVYWRRARLIPPLHPRDTYVVSPNADIRNLAAAITAYASRFPTLPSLPKMLSMLSGNPRPYRFFIPTTEHREAFMEILAWLMRGGWVTQLRTFCWVRVTAEIKAEVALDMEREERIKKAEEGRRMEVLSDNDSTTESVFSNTTADKRAGFFALGSGRPSTPLRRTRRDRDRERDDEGEPLQMNTNNLNLSMDASTILSPRTGYRGSPARPSSDAGSTSSNRTAIPLLPPTGIGNHPASPSPNHKEGAAKLHKPSPLHLNPKPTSPTRTHHALSPTQTFNDRNPSSPSLLSPPPMTSSAATIIAKDYAPSLILSPQKCSSLEARWLEKIGSTFSTTTITTTTTTPSHSPAKQKQNNHQSQSTQEKDKEPEKGKGEVKGGADTNDLVTHWPMLLKYFDGKHALEDIAMREGIKRKRVWGWYLTIRERGWLVVVRHW
ncbi:nitrogen permease regulator of amino acid transport activity 3-domain-containing protein [Clohesyomyces aquaticus]|uniref:Nitrogen permease regulator 3 n=1 Tax=Clohesyomyces aquaticus TaxID=1231657 RepID=A0A1Y1YXT1_9PLEO|nr:nitrogen permease regulator of amino acid transport activity 3-domain-containing protein [Clohesyomyces aquaticus]